MDHRRLTRPYLPVVWSAAVLFFVAVLCVSPSRADDDLFLPASNARPFVDIDGRGFLINGQRTFLVSGSLHYARLPHAQWRERILQFKRAGFNTIQTYAFWNFHERKQGQWTFDGDADLDLFLKTCKALDMYAVVRVGPYVCAEWENGGYPNYLRFIPGLAVREPNEPFQAACDQWMEHVMPIVAANQIHKGGAVVMVQLENEHPRGWGTDMPDAYFRHLREKALSLGLEVPYFFSGLHHGFDPAGNRGPWDSTGRRSPWYTTEFWAGWYNQYAPQQIERLAGYDRNAWKIVAWGGNGFNDYMFFGGTNFDHFNDDEGGASYDYGAAIGQTGDLRPLYFAFKRVAMFATSFPNVLEDSVNATPAFASAAPGVEVYARKSDAGTILFLENKSDHPVKTRVRTPDAPAYPADTDLTVAAHQFLPIVLKDRLDENVELRRAAGVVGVCRQGQTTTLVVATPPGETEQLAMASSAPIDIKPGVPGLTVTGEEVTLKATASEAGPAEFVFNTGGRTYRILLVTPNWANRVWFVDAGGARYVVCGPAYVGETTATAAGLTLNVETPTAVADAAAGQSAFVYGATPGAMRGSVPAIAGASATDAPKTSVWTWAAGDASAARALDDSAWRGTHDPEPMGADDNDAPYVWYRATLHAPAAGRYTLAFSALADWAAVYVDGKCVGTTDDHGRLKQTPPAAISLDLPAGDSALAVFASHGGRAKFFPTVGPIADLYAKGICGPVRLVPGQWKPAAERISGWNYTLLAQPSDDASPPVVSPDHLQPARPNADVFEHHDGSAWFQTSLFEPRSVSPHSQFRVSFNLVRNTATVYLNGKKIATHQGRDPFSVDLGDGWRHGAANELGVLVQSSAGQGGILQTATLEACPDATGVLVTDWKMRGGEETPRRDTQWQTVPPRPGPAAWYHASFDAGAAVDPALVLRLTTTGLSRGSVYVNGHCVGRYPDPTPVNGLYLPGPWLKPGTNDLLIFDEAGASPAEAKIVVETAACRTHATINVSQP